MRQTISTVVSQGWINEYSKTPYSMKLTPLGSEIIFIGYCLNANQNKRIRLVSPKPEISKLKTLPEFLTRIPVLTLPPV